MDCKTCKYRSERCSDARGSSYCEGYVREDTLDKYENGKNEEESLPEDMAPSIVAIDMEE